MRRKLPWFLFAASLAANLFFVAGAIVGRVASDDTPPGTADRLAAVAQELDLDEAQAAALGELRREFRSRWQANRQAGQSQRRAMLAEIAKPDFDRETFLRLADERFQQRRELFADFAQSLHAYLRGLTPEQRRKFLAMAEERGFLRSLFRSRPAGNKDG